MLISTSMHSRPYVYFELARRLYYNTKYYTYYSAVKAVINARWRRRGLYHRVHALVRSKKSAKRDDNKSTRNTAGVATQQVSKKNGHAET